MTTLEWRESPGDHLQAPISYTSEGPAHYVISHRHDRHTISWRPPGEHKHLGTCITPETARARAEVFEECRAPIIRALWAELDRLGARGDRFGAGGIYLDFAGATWNVSACAPGPRLATSVLGIVDPPRALDVLRALDDGAGFKPAWLALSDLVDG